MPDSETNTQPKEKKPYFSEPSTPPAGLLKFRRPLILISHIGAFAASLMLSFLLAMNLQFQRTWLLEQYPLLLLFFIIIKLVVFGLFKQYRGWWRYVGISDLIGILRACLVSTLIIVILWFTVVLQIDLVRRYLQNIADVAQSIFLLDMFGKFLLLAGLRMVIRLYHEEYRAVETGRLTRFLIVGAGDAGEELLRAIHHQRVAQYDVVGFIDDDPVKQGTLIHGLAVLGTVDELPKICEAHNIEEIAIAMPSATHSQVRRVIRLCEGTKIRFRTVPSITDIAAGKFKVSQIRDVDINDLLGREAVELDLELIEAFARDKTILVTGAGGSIGSEMCRQLCNFNPRLLLLIEQSENPLFYIERELRQRFPQVAIKAVICNITDKRRRRV
jgi:FlaA1/EpsC-like NDP-sugar epimerase